MGGLDWFSMEHDIRISEKINRAIRTVDLLEFREYKNVLVGLNAFKPFPGQTRPFNFTLANAR